MSRDVLRRTRSRAQTSLRSLARGASTARSLRSPRSLVLPIAGALGMVVGAGGFSAPSSATPTSCTAEVSSSSAAATQASSLADGSTLCLSSGAYSLLTLSKNRTGYITIQPSPGASITLAGVSLSQGASHYKLDGLTIDGDITLQRGGASFLTVTNTSMKGFAAYWGSHDLLLEHSAINGGGQTGEGIALISIDCASPNAPYYSGCTTYPTVSNVVVRGNRITGPFGDDAINISHYDNILIEDNEITKVIENGEHNDTLQSTFGGKNLTFRRNYVHDICGQGFFLKDGRVDNVVYDNNLIVRDGGCPLAPSGELALDVFDTHGLQITKNTFVSAGMGEELQNYDAGPADSSAIVMHHNVMDNFAVAWQSPSSYHDSSVLLEDHNILAKKGNWVGNGWQSPTDSLAAPSFTNPATDDYRATPVTAGGSTYTAGIDWRPADFTYGPVTGTATTPTTTATVPTTTTTVPTTTTTVPTDTTTTTVPTTTTTVPTDTTTTTVPTTTTTVPTDTTTTTVPTTTTTVPTDTTTTTVPTTTTTVPTDTTTTTVPTTTTTVPAPIPAPQILSTSITSAPPSPTTSTTATFKFTSSDANATFTCQLDGGRKRSCTSPKTWTGLKTGSHTVKITAVDTAAGLTDPVGATHAWSIVSCSRKSPCTYASSLSTMSTAKMAASKARARAKARAQAQAKAKAHAKRRAAQAARYMRRR